MDHAAVRGIPEGVGGCGYVVAAPHRRPEVLRDLFVNPVSEDGKLAVEIVIDADDFFPHMGGHVIAALEGRLSFAIDGIICRENTGCQQRLRVRIEHASRNRVAGKRLSFRESRQKASSRIKTRTASRLTN